MSSPRPAVAAPVPTQRARVARLAEPDEKMSIPPPPFTPSSTNRDGAARRRRALARRHRHHPARVHRARPASTPPPPLPLVPLPTAAMSPRDRPCRARAGSSAPDAPLAEPDEKRHPATAHRPRVCRPNDGAARRRRALARRHCHHPPVFTVPAPQAPPPSAAPLAPPPTVSAIAPRDRPSLRPCRAQHARSCPPRRARRENEHPLPPHPESTES